MPYRKRKSSRRKQSSGTVTSLSMSPFPDSIITKMRYSESIALDASTSVPAYHLFSCNGLYDPNISGTGHQPLGFDQYTGIYDHYTVLGSKITVEAMPQFYQNMVGVYISDDVTPVGTYDTIIEQGGAVVKAVASTGGPSSRITKGFSAKRFFGVTDVLDVDKLKGSLGANPADGAYFVVFTQSADSGLNPSATIVNVTIEYIVKWTERQPLAQS